MRNKRIREIKCRKPECLQGRMIRLDGDFPYKKKLGRLIETGYAFLSQNYDTILEIIYDLSPVNANAYQINHGKNSGVAIQFYSLNKKQINQFKREILKRKYPTTMKSNPLTLEERAKIRRDKEEYLGREAYESRFREQLKEEYRDRISRDKWNNSGNLGP